MPDFDPEALAAAALTPDPGSPEAAHTTCPRCGSADCPGRGDAMDCTATIDGKTVADETKAAEEAAAAAPAAKKAKGAAAKAPAAKPRPAGPTAAERAAATADRKAQEAQVAATPEGRVAAERATLQGWPDNRLRSEAKRLTGADYVPGQTPDELRDTIAAARVERQTLYEDAARKRHQALAGQG